MLIKSSRLLKILLLNVCVSTAPKSIPSWFDNNSLATIDIHPKTVLHKRGQWLRWEKPTLLFKLNTDGLANEGLCTGGGVIRDYNGYFIAAFSAAYGQSSNMQAEDFALRDGLKLC